MKLLTLEPIVADYSPQSDAWWGSFSRRLEPDVLFSMRFWNPIYFLAAIVLVVVGWRKRWLTVHELALAAGLLLIPYVTRGYDFGMCSQVRFGAVCFPIYLVVGRLVAVLPNTWRILVFTLFTAYLAAFATMFSVGGPVF